MRSNLSRLAAAALLAALPVAAAAAAENAPHPSHWASVEAAARGQHVHWYAWGGEAHINDFISWVGDRVAERYGVTLTQVKLADTAEAVARVLAETTAGRTEGGAVDLIWINGENFVAMKENGLLEDGEWAEALPNWELVDLDQYGAAILTDFAVPVEGQQSPWGRAQLVYLYDEDRTTPPKSLGELVDFAAENPGRFTYPRPPNFIGTSFLKQVLINTVPDPSVLLSAAGEDGEALVRAHMLPLLEQIHPNLWRSGGTFPSSVADLRRLFADGEIALSLTHNPSDGEVGVRAGTLPPSVRVGAFEGGTLGNVHFVAVPHNANDKAGAFVVANFLLSPEAQARKADPEFWGDPTVIDVAALSGADQAGFANTPSVNAPTLQEPHASWTPIIEKVWADAFLR